MTLKNFLVTNSFKAWETAGIQPRIVMNLLCEPLDRDSTSLFLVFDHCNEWQTCHEGAIKYRAKVAKFLVVLRALRWA